MDVACLENQHARLLVQQQKRRTVDSLSPGGESVNKSDRASLHAGGGRDAKMVLNMDSKGDVVRSRLGGVASNRAGGATAVVAVIMRVGEVMYQIYSCSFMNRIITSNYFSDKKIRGNAGGIYAEAQPKRRNRPILYWGGVVVYETPGFPITFQSRMKADILSWAGGGD